MTKLTEAERLDAEALAVVCAEVGMDQAVAARVIGRYREVVEVVENEPEWQAVSHMHGPGWSASTYVAEGCQISMTVWSDGKGKSERAYGARGLSGEGYETFREAVAALAGNSFRPGPTARTRQQKEPEA